MSANTLTPFVIPVPAGAEGNVRCSSNASYQQRVTLSWEGQTRTFEGNGENMRLDADTGENMCVLHPRSDNQPYDVTITFAYSSDNGESWQQPNKVTGPKYTSDDAQQRVERIDFATEDAMGDDDNDTFLVITFKYGFIGR